MALNERKEPLKIPIIDRVVSYFNPTKGAERFRSRVFLNMAETYYTGASKTRRQTKEWGVRKSAPDSTVWERATLVDRGHDLFRNAPVARGAVQTNTTNVIGSGLMLQPRINRSVLNLTEEQAEELEAALKREYNFWADSLESDVRRTVPFNRSHDMAFANMLIAGDVFNFMRNFKSDTTPYTLCYQMIEGARVSNPDGTPDKKDLIAGVQKNELGAPIGYHVSRFHPAMYMIKDDRKWDYVPRFGEGTGRLNVIHLFKPERPGQTRGISWLAPIVELIKQLTDYTEAEIMAAVVSGMFTVFVKTKGAEGLDQVTDLGDETGAASSDKDFKLGYGMVVDLDTEEDIQTADPNRPNTAFGPFVEQILQQIGVALNIPFEILIKHFRASYSASRAALMEAWKFFISERKWFALTYCQPVYAAWLDEAVAIGRISAPGYFNDPLIRAAYLRAEWIGPPRGMIDEKKEIEAAEKRVDLGISTLAEETAALTGGEFHEKHPQRVKEKEMRVRDGLDEPVGAKTAPIPSDKSQSDITLEDLNDE